MSEALDRPRAPTPALVRALRLADAHPHDFTIQYPPRREYFMEAFAVPEPQRAAELAEAQAKLLSAEPLLLYCHVPFCATKCHYCNFAVDTRSRPSLHARYVDGLVRELERLGARLPASTKIGGIDIGGGTPTLLDLDALDRLLAALAPFVDRARDSPFAFGPVSIETTPAIAAREPDKLARLAEGGVARVSMGVQSTDAATLEALNRGRHGSAAGTDLQARALANLRGAGFERVNVDLIFGLPDQGLNQWRRDLDTVLAAAPDSITTYDCLYRGKGRVLTRKHDASGRPRPTPERYAALYDLAFERLRAAGYVAPYGSVNFARRPGETGTSAYFEGRLLDGHAYLGVGNYASSQTGARWWFAPYKVDRWLEAVESGVHLPAGDLYRLPAGERAAKQLLLALSFGVVDGARLRRAHGIELDAVCGPALEFALSRGYLVPDGDERWTLAPGRFDVLPRLRALFYTAAATAWLDRQRPGLRVL